MSGSPVGDPTVDRRSPIIAPKIPNVCRSRRYTCAQIRTKILMYRHLTRYRTLIRTLVRGTDTSIKAESSVVSYVRKLIRTRTSIRISTRVSCTDTVTDTNTSHTYQAQIRFSTTNTGIVYRVQIQRWLRIRIPFADTDFDT